MKICPECEKPLPEEVTYCVYCGTKADLPKQTKSERKIFFLTPIFLFFISLALTYDLSCKSYFETAVTLAGISSLLYFSGAAALGILKFFFNISVLPGSYFNAGISSLTNGITIFFLAKIIENLFLFEKIEKIGPSIYIQNQLLLFALIFVPLQFIEILAISAKAKLSQQPQNSFNSIQKFILSKTCILMPILLIIVCIIGIKSMPHSFQIALMSETLLNISSYDKANENLDNGLKNYPDNPQLCYLKSIYLTHQLVSSSPNSTTGLEKKALEYAEIATKQKPNSSIYKFQLCHTLELNQDFDKALQIASEAATIADNDPYLWQYLGDLNQKYLNKQEAINAYQKSLSYNPQNSVVMNNLAYVLITNNDNIDMGIELAQKSLELSPESISGRDTLAWGYYKQKRYPEALETISVLYENITEISPEIDFHYAAILNSMELLNNPIETFDKMLVNPEILVNVQLRNDIFEERQRTHKKLIEKK